MVFSSYARTCARTCARNIAARIQCLPNAYLNGPDRFPCTHVALGTTHGNEY